MTLRRLLNVAYAVLAEGKSQKDLASFDSWLESEPTPAAKQRETSNPLLPSRGSADLMSVLGGVDMPKPKRPKQRKRPKPQGATS